MWLSISPSASFPLNLPSPTIFVATGGLDSRDVAFMERLRNLAREALTWEHLSDQRRLVWAAALELDVVPVQEVRAVGREWSYGCRVRLCSFAVVVKHVEGRRTFV